MKKKIFLMLAAMAILVCVFAVSASAQETSVDNEYFVSQKLYQSATNEFGTVNVVSETSNVYYYSSTLDTTSRMVLKNSNGTYSTYPTIYVMYTVTDSQGPRYGFDLLNTITGEEYDISSIARIEFPEGTNHVRAGFAGNTELVYVKIASTVGQIKGVAFQNCSNLAKVEFRLDFEKYPEFGSNLSSINNGSVFANCTSLTELVLPNSVVSVCTGAISGCTNLKLFNPGASFTKTNGQPIGYPSESFILSHAYEGNYKLFSWSSAYAASTNLVIYYTGTLTQAETLQENETYCYEIKCSTLVSYADFTSADFSRDSNVHYLVYGYNYCEAFYSGEHLLSEVNDCVSTCSRCNGTIVEHEATAEEIELTYVSFDAAGTKNVTCANEGCTHNVTIEAPALFVCLGYSIPEDDAAAGIAIGFTVNNEAINEYEKVTGKEVKYGVFAVLKDKLGDNDVFAKDGALAEGAIAVEISNHKLSAFELKIVGVTDTQKDVKLAMGAFVKVVATDGETTASEYSYMQGGTPAEGDDYYFVSYNDIVNASTSTDTAADTEVTE